MKYLKTTVVCCLMTFHVYASGNAPSQVGADHAAGIGAIGSCGALLAPSSTQIVYRALVLEWDSTARTIANAGMDSPYLLNGSKADPKQRIHQLPSQPSNETHRLIYQRYKQLRPGSLDTNPYMSVSRYPDVAVAVANSYRGEKLGSVYLFRMEIERADIVRLGIDFPNPWRIRIAKALGLNTIIEFSDGRKNTYVFNEDVESFVYWRVPPRQIKGVFKMSAQVSPLFSAGLRKAESRPVDEDSFLQQLRPVDFAEDQ